MGGRPYPEVADEDRGEGVESLAGADGDDVVARRRADGSGVGDGIDVPSRTMATIETLVRVRALVSPSVRPA